MGEFQVIFATSMCESAKMVLEEMTVRRYKKGSRQFHIYLISFDMYSLHNRSKAGYESKLPSWNRKNALELCRFYSVLVPYTDRGKNILLGYINFGTINNGVMILTY
jgi:hypothetical protein